jgi:hypothetical protein
MAYGIEPGNQGLTFITMGDQRRDVGNLGTRELGNLGTRVWSELTIINNSCVHVQSAGMLEVSLALMGYLCPNIRISVGFGGN